MITYDRYLAILAQSDAAVQQAARQAFAKLLEKIRQGQAPRSAIDAILREFNAEALTGFREAFSAVLESSLGEKEIKAWPVGGVKLSDRLYDHAQKVSATTRQMIEQHLKGLHSARELRKALYEGYNFQDDPLKIIKPLPKYLQVEFDQFKAAQLKTPALRAAYLEAIRKAEAGAGMEAIEKQLRIAFYERNRYFANRIARTELHRNYTDQQARDLMAEDRIQYVQFRMSLKHPRTDICNLHAELDAWGLGPGIYPKAAAPKPPIHPFCGCRVVPRLSVRPQQPPKFNPKAERDFLKSLPAKEARDVAGSWEKRRRILEDQETLETIYNEGKDELYRWKRVGDIITTQQPLPVQQAMAIDERDLRRKLNDLYVQCAEKKPEFDALVTRLAQQSKPLLVPLKSDERALEKVITSLGGNLDGLTDVLRATLVFETTADVVTAHNALLNQVSVLRERNLYREGVSLSDGYRDAKIDIDLDGIPVELQLNTRKMLEAKEKAHQLYEEKRQLLAGKRSAGSLSADQKRQLRELDRQMRKIYQEAE
ncbi:MAG: hypothetical protein WAW42_17215 [Candidatus Competibacteraceae bacterium]